MNVFSIIGPVMIGPSSSHTAGACRIGRIVYLMTHGTPLKKVTIELSGSFAHTYQGHGTDKAIMAGLMGYQTDSIEIRDALNIARDRRIDFTFVPTHIPDSHPNTARITYELENGEKGSLMGASIGGGNIRVEAVNGMRVNLTGERTTVMVLHNDVPGVIADVTSMISEKYSQLNICNFTLGRQEKGGLALMTMEFDNPCPDSLKEDIEQVDEVVNTVVFPAI